jgi:hypothetical protein
MFSGQPLPDVPSVQQFCAPGYTTIHTAIMELFEELKRSYVLERAKKNYEAGHEVFTDAQLVARHIASNIALHGRLHGGHEEWLDIRAIPKAALETHRFSDDASQLIHLFYESNYYADLHVRTDELEAFKYSELFNQGFYEK